MAFFLEKITGVKNDVAHTIDEIGDAIDEDGGVLNAIENKATKVRDEIKVEVGKRIASKLNEAFAYSMDTVCVHVKEKATDDPYMPGFAQSTIHILIDAVWPDVKSEVKEAVFSIVSDPPPIDHGPEPCCRWWPWTVIRYCLFPYDRNIWRKIRDPLWWLLLVISLIPWMGITQIYHLLLFLVIDKRDEFQLLEYIAIFKSLQFISLGCIGCMIGSIQYYICTTKKPTDCYDNGPKEQVFTLGLFVAQIIVCWIAFLLTFTARQKGGRIKVMSASSQQLVSEKRKGGKDTVKEVMLGDVIEEATFQPDDELDARCKTRFMLLLIYDFILFIICAALTIWAAFGNLLNDDASVSNNSEAYTERNWQFTATLYWIKSLYGLLSFPFIILRLPVLNSLFAHVKPTGYNWWGRCVTYLGQEEKSVPWRPNPETEPLTQKA